MNDILEQIIELQPVLHAAGTLSAPALRAIAAHAAERTIVYSAETGCGATTLLLSHLSQSHTVFSLDMGGSVSSVLDSPLLRPGVVKFVEGPSQRTLPQFRFDANLQLALIDGAHAYPFPDLEYYYLYPHLDAGALLVIDDIHIRSIYNLFEFLRRDAMFRLEDVVRTTALFSRTDAPTFDPFGDGWEQQGYNRQTLWRYDWRSRLGKILPRSLRDALRHPAYGRSLVRITEPGAGGRVATRGEVTGTADVPKDAYLWVLVHRKDVAGWWPQGGGPIPVSNGEWKVDVKYGDPDDVGHPFEIAATVVPFAVHERWLRWIDRVSKTGLYPPVQLPSGAALISISYRTVKRR
jgi:hypothetical protein